MKKNFKGFLLLVLILSLTMATLVGCSKPAEEGKKEEVVKEVKDEKKEEAKEEAGDYPFEFKDDNTVVDSSGRTIKLPENIEKIIPAGNPAQMVLYSIAPEKMGAFTSKPSEETQKYMDEKYMDLPEVGTFYGKKANMNLEEVIKADADLIIDVGERKDGIEEDMDMIQEQTGVPTIFIEGEITQLPDMYRTLGKLVGKEEESKPKADYIENTLKDAKEKSETLKDEDKVRVFFGSGDNGQQTNPDGSIHADVLNYIGAKNVYEGKAEKGSSWEEVSMEQIIAWNPELVLLTDEGTGENLLKDDAWKDIEAIKNQKVFETPNAPYNWMGRPPMINRVIGIKWAGNLLYPELYDYDMVEEAKEFYSLFYNYELTDEEAKDLMKNSTFK